MLLAIMQKAAKASGKIIEKGFNKNLEIDYKEDGSIVTHIDKKSEEVILKILNKKTNFNIFSEEAGEFNKDSEFLWVVDPLDGTTNYSRGIPFFSVSIGLFKNNKPYAGVIYNPLSKEMFYAEKGQGAFLNKKRLSPIKPGRTVGIIYERGSKGSAKTEYTKVIGKTSHSYESIRTFGSSALELAYIAAGRMDGFTTYGDRLYDIAAGIIIAKEAGCKVTNWKGKPWNIDDEDLLVTNKFLHKELLEKIEA